MLSLGITLLGSSVHRGADPCRLFQKSARVCKVCVWRTFYRLFADFFCGSSTVMQTFCRLFLRTIYSNAHFLHTYCILFAVNDSSSADFMHTFSVFADFLQNICTLSVENMLPFADFMHTYSRLDADLMQIKMVHCGKLADSMHTLRRANQCH